ncbi:hypothetical protein ACIQKB_02725 [Streptomyces sp. NPDC092046]|uniref:hypothetical protein n=1 Tax=Streptomyces sp. NPDC092046 TaxID=3366009 RepID=UPI0038021A28
MRSLTALAAGVALGAVAGAAQADTPRHAPGTATTLTHDVDVPDIDLDDIELLNLLGG